MLKGTDILKMAIMGAVAGAAGSKTLGGVAASTGATEPLSGPKKASASSAKTKMLPKRKIRAFILVPPIEQFAPGDPGDRPRFAGVQAWKAPGLANSKGGFFQISTTLGFFVVGIFCIGPFRNFVMAHSVHDSTTFTVQQMWRIIHTSLDSIEELYPMLAATGFQWGDLVAGKGLGSEIYVKSQGSRGTEKREVICGKSVYCRSG
jgi:hypothetical protein